MMSQREYAAARGVSAGAVWRAVQDGRLPALDGRIDPAVADATWFRRHQQRAELSQTSAEAEARRERALLTSTVAKVQMTRRRAERLRLRTIERDAAQASIGKLVDLLVNDLWQRIADGASDADRPVLLAAGAKGLADLGDLSAEALRVTRQE